jgi:hypothetical protein
MSWLHLIAMEGQRIGDKVKFTAAAIKEALEKHRVPHIAKFLTDNKIEDITVSEQDCTEEKITR